MASSHAVAAIVNGVSTVDEAVNVIASNHGVSAAGTCSRIHSSVAVSIGARLAFQRVFGHHHRGGHQREQAHHRRAAAVDVLAPGRALQPQHQPQREVHRDHAERELSNFFRGFEQHRQIDSPCAARTIAPNGHPLKRARLS